MPDKIRILIVEDQFFFRLALHSIVDARSGTAVAILAIDHVETCGLDNNIVRYNLALRCGQRLEIVVASASPSPADSASS